MRRLRRLPGEQAWMQGSPVRLPLRETGFRKIGPHPPLRGDFPRRQGNGAVALRGCPGLRVAACAGPLPPQAEEDGRRTDGGEACGKAAYTTSGSLNASGSSSAEPTGMQLQNTFLSPCTLSTRATGGQYFCRRRLGSGNTASSRG